MCQIGVKYLIIFAYCALRSLSLLEFALSLFVTNQSHFSSVTPIFCVTTVTTFYVSRIEVKYLMIFAYCAIRHLSLFEFALSLFVTNQSHFPSLTPNFRVTTLTTCYISRIDVRYLIIFAYCALRSLSLL